VICQISNPGKLVPQKKNPQKNNNPVEKLIVYNGVLNLINFIKNKNKKEKKKKKKLCLYF